MFYSILEGVTKYSITVGMKTWNSSRRNFSLVGRYSLKFTRYLLLVIKSLVTRYEIRSLLVAKNHSLLIANLLVTCCRSCSLQKTTRYSLQNLLVTCCRSCSLQKITRYSFQNLLVTRCRSCSLQKLTRYSLPNSLVARYRSGVTFCNFMKKKLQHRCFPVNFWEILRTPILWKIKERLLQKIISKYQQTFYSFLRQVFRFDLI